MEASIIIPGLKESVIKACDDTNWKSTRNLLLQWLKKESLEYQQLMNIPNNSINLLLDCCLYGYIELISVLINNNFPVNYEINRSVFRFSNTMFHFATVGRQLPLMKYLVSHGADVNYVSQAGYTPLHCLFITEIMLKISNADGKKMYSSNNQNSQIDVLKFLLDSGSNIHGKCRLEKVPLHYAVAEGNIDCVKLLINYGSDVNARDLVDRTALYYAVTSEHSTFQIVELLLNAGTCIIPRYTLNASLMKGNLNIIELLLKRGADVNEMELNNKTLFHNYVFFINGIGNIIHRTVCGNVVNVMGTLVLWGADVNISDDCGRTLLHWASWKGSVHLVKLLIDRGLDVKDKLGKKPIHYASDAGHHNVVQYFIDYYFDKFM